MDEIGHKFQKFNFGAERCGLPIGWSKNLFRDVTCGGRSLVRRWEGHASAVRGEGGDGIGWRLTRGSVSVCVCSSGLYPNYALVVIPSLPPTPTPHTPAAARLPVHPPHHAGRITHIHTQPKHKQTNHRPGTAIRPRVKDRDSQTEGKNLAGVARQLAPWHDD